MAVVDMLKVTELHGSSVQKHPFLADIWLFAHRYVLLYMCVLMWQNYVGHDGSDRHAESRRLICSTVYQLLVVSYVNMSPFIRNKMCKLVVHVARQDWPHSYSDFFTNIYTVWQSRLAVFSVNCLIIWWTAVNVKTAVYGDLQWVTPRNSNSHKRWLTPDVNHLLGELFYCKASN